MTNLNRHPASFRDPSGFIYEKDGEIFRFVSSTYSQHFQKLKSSGLYTELIEKKQLLPFEEITENHTDQSDWLTTLHPLQIPFLNYAWEWSFEQLKDAALTTLNICKSALERGMILKDATHFNIQFVNGKPLLIDTLSFEIYEEGSSWIAYRQFCECFLNPLLLACYCKMEAHKLLLSYPEGVSTSHTAQWLPLSSKFNASVLLHVHLHAKVSKKKNIAVAKSKSFSTKSIFNILQSLEECITNLKPDAGVSTWNNYYAETIISNEYLEEKKNLVSSWLKTINYTSALDLGANDGEFSMLCSKEALVVAADFDSSCISNLYTKLKHKKITNIVPLVIDASYPSPSMGWINREQPAFLSRKKFDLCLALALIHHIVIGKNITMEMIANFFADRCNYLLIEFVPKTDTKVIEMLQSRKDIFQNYSQEGFEAAFSVHFEIQQKAIIQNSERSLYILQRRG